MTEDEKREFIMKIFRDSENETTNNLEIVLYKLEQYKGYEDVSENDIKYAFLQDFPEDVELNSNEIQQIIDIVYGLTGNFYNEDGIKRELVSFVFSHVTDEAKINYFRSAEFEQFCTNNVWGAEGVRNYNIDAIFSTIKEIGAAYEGLSRKEEAILKQRLGFLPHRLTFKEAMVQYIDSFDRDENDLQRQQEQLELFLAIADVEVDLNVFTEKRNKNTFLESDVFKNIVNEYYEKLTIEQRKDFISELSYDRTFWGRRQEIGYEQETMQNNLQIFRVIEDKEKFDNAGINVLAAALEADIIEQGNIVQILLKINELYEDDAYIYRYFEAIENEERLKLQLSTDQIANLLSQRAQIGNERLLWGIFNATSPECIKDYLYANPENISFCMDVLNVEDAQEVLQNFDSQIYRARLLMSMQSEAKDIANLFPEIEDDYVRAQIIIAKMENDRYVGDADTIERIENFFDVREELLNLPPDERVDFICSLHIPNPDETTLTYKDVNEMKKSFLAFVDKPEDRRKVIESMERNVDPDIQEYVDVVETMLREYIEDRLELTEEQKERFEIELRTNDVYFKTYDVEATNGEARYIDKDITIANHSRGDHQNIIVDMLHEYAHVFSNSRFITSAYHVGHTFEEGMADTFAEQVANHYLDKHGEIIIYGEAIEAESPLVSQSSYHFENGWTKTMMYILENGMNIDENQTIAQDQMAIGEFIFGSKAVFFEECMGEEFLEDYDVDYLGRPINVEVTERELAGRYITLACSENAKSLYTLKNDRLGRVIDIVREMEAEMFPIESVEESGLTQGQAAAAAYSLERDMEYERQRNSERGR